MKRNQKKFKHFKKKFKHFFEKNNVFVQKRRKLSFSVEYKKYAAFTAAYYSSKGEIRNNEQNRFGSNHRTKNRFH